MLCKKDLRPGAAERHLRRALMDKSPRVVSVAIRIAGSQPEAEMTALLGDFVGGRFGFAPAAESQQERACDALLQKGEAGRRQLQNALRALSWNLHLKHMQRSELIVRMLEPFVTSDPAARESVRAWRRSPARWVMTLFPRRSDPAGGSPSAS
jgi:hypothetical protein